MKQKVLSIITARGGSKGLPKKNLLNFNGKPLFSWTLEASLNSQFISKTIVSSDDELILSIAKDYNSEIPLKRSKKLSGDDSNSVDVVIDIIKKFPNYNYVIILQPTSPLRTTKHINEAFNLMIKKDSSCCTSVCLVKKSPYWMYSINKKGFIEKVINSNEKDFQRQALPEIYELNGAIYIISVQELLRYKSLISKNSIPYIMTKETSIDIDDINDFKLAEKAHMKILS